MADCHYIHHPPVKQVTTTNTCPFFRAADLIGDRVRIQTNGNEQQSASRENVMKITFRHEDPKKQNNKHRKKLQ